MEQAESNRQAMLRYTYRQLSDSLGFERVQRILEECVGVVGCTLAMAPQRHAVSAFPES